MKVAWFSAGVSSAVATKMMEPDRIIYFHIDDQHSDTLRFVKDCEEWFGREVEVMRSPLYRSVEECCLACAFIRGPHSAVCSDRMKRRVRKEWELENPGRHTYVWEMGAGERGRIDRLLRAMPEHDHVFPIEHFTKTEVHGLLAAEGLRRPSMYDLGYQNNNCIGCVKGGMAYWNKIREDFPQVFARRAAMERRIGAHMLQECYLDDLDPQRGRGSPPIVPDCGAYCAVEEDLK